MLWEALSVFIVDLSVGRLVEKKGILVSHGLRGHGEAPGSGLWLQRCAFDPNCAPAIHEKSEAMGLARQIQLGSIKCPCDSRRIAGIVEVCRGILEPLQVPLQQYETMLRIPENRFEKVEIRRWGS